MKLLGTIVIRGNGGKRIELLRGDLTKIAATEAFDLLIVSAFPGDYSPTPSSLIGALYRKGLSVESLAADKELDLRDGFACWLSHEFVSPHADLRFNQILCFEPMRRGHPPAVVGDIFRMLTPVLAEKTNITTVAMPLVAAGDQGYSVSEMLEPLLDASIHWLENGLPLQVLKIVAYSDDEAEEAEKIFDSKLATYTASSPRSLGPTKDFDVFISYAHENSSDIALFEKTLLGYNPDIKIFLDRKSIDIGVAWQPEIFESLDRCRKVVAMFSPDYLASKVCKEEFNIAWARSREIEQEIIFPIYLYSTNLPTYMKYRNYLDCREGDIEQIEKAATMLIQALGN